MAEPLRTAVVALGGNAIIRAGQSGTAAEQQANLDAMAPIVRDLVGAGWRVVLVHGNGPQVGNLAVQQDAGADQVPGLPLFLLDAMTAGQLGSQLTLALHAVDPRLPAAVAVITHVEVDAADPAFEHPTKPVGPFLTEAEAHRRAAERGWTVGEDAGRGYRRLVASPAPRRIVELDAVRTLVGCGLTVIAAGGGGVPVVADGRGYRGVEAVIDKDLAAQLLADAVDAQALVLITDVPQVELDHGTDRARPVAQMTVAQARAHTADQQFPAGSMGPKVAAAVGFAERGGDRIAVITNAERAAESLSGTPGPGAGTRIVAAARPTAAQPTAAQSTAAQSTGVQATGAIA
jgi:carbamate kinase